MTCICKLCIIVSDTILKTLSYVTWRDFLFVCLFVCIEYKHPSQQFFSYVGMEPTLSGF